MQSYFKLKKILISHLQGLFNYFLFCFLDLELYVLMIAVQLMQNTTSHGRRKVHERILVILADQPEPNGQLSCLHSFKIFWPMKPSYTSNEMT